jgi:VanZ family protein
MGRLLVALAGMPARWRWAIWAFYALAWTVALEVRHPDLHFIQGGPHEKVHKELLFLFAKTVHVAAYAVFAILTGWLRPGSPLRWFLLGLLVLHAAGTEYLQNLLPFDRTGSVRDVGLDLVGIGLGITVSWKWWWRINGPAEAVGQAP